MGNKRQGIARDPLWYKDAIIYQLHVRSFCDSNADGIGDFVGLATKLDYLRDLGVTAIWVMPFYPSPLKDDGYDIADYYEINPIYGTLDEFKTFLDEAHARGLRVITELVINHTSDQHAWFQKSRRAMARLSEKARRSTESAIVPPAPDDTYRDFYVWTHDPSRYKEVRIIFKDFEPSNWTWDPLAQAYYWHRFFSHQPDLNFDNPSVHDEIIRTIDYWCDMGVDGFRLDAIPYLYEREGTSGESLPETHAFIKKLRAHVDQKYGDRVFLAEANQWPEEAVTYFGQGRGDECHMAFHFPVMPRLFMAVRMEDRVPIVDILEQTPPLPETAQWAVFLRNHDELTLEMVTDEERDYMYRVYAHETKARINLGIRRRLAPLLGNDRKKIELLNLLLLSLPGTPVIYYGDEIGMGDNIYLGDRNGVRTPMHWSPDKNAGFSRATPQALQLPIIMDPEYHYEAINVETQQRNPHSLLWWTKRVLALRKKWRAFGSGTIEFLHPKNRKVLAFLRRHGEETILVVANLSRFPQPVELDLSAFNGIRPRELFGRTRFPAIGDSPYLLTLSPHAAFWFSLVRKAEEIQPRTEVPSITVEKDWREAVTGSALLQLETALPDYLRQQRWFAGRGRDIDSVVLSDVVALNDEVFLTLATVHYVGVEPETYFLPIACAPAAEVDALSTGKLRRLIAGLRGGSDGVLYDASVAEPFASALLAAAAGNWRGRTLRSEFSARGATEIAAAAGGPISMRVDFNNTSFVMGGRYFVKLFRRLEPGIHPELEMTRFLSAHHFQHVPQFQGALECRRDGELLQAGLVTDFIPNAVSDWEAALDSLGRYFDRIRGLPADAPVPTVSDHLLALSATPLSTELTTLLGAFAEVIRLLGRRTGEMHATLASDPDWPDFAPEAFTPFYQRSIYQSMRNRTVEVLDTLKQSLESLPESTRPFVTEVASQQTAILARLRAIHQSPIDGQRIRIHGDYHLAQVLHTGKDHVVIDLEGEWSRPISERRIKRCSLYDVVGMIRSIHYVGAVALNRQQEQGQVSAERLGTLEPWVRLWTRQMSALFLRGYLDAVASTNLLPKEQAHLDILLNAMLLDRTLAELGHELSNRPESVHIPLRGLLDLLVPT
jgi:maltose alpha-D-glucosyltransferase/alpha-amylase